MAASSDCPHSMSSAAMRVGMPSHLWNKSTCWKSRMSSILTNHRQVLNPPLISFFHADEAGGDFAFEVPESARAQEMYSLFPTLRVLGSQATQDPGSRGRAGGRAVPICRAQPQMSLGNGSQPSRLRGGHPGSWPGSRGQPDSGQGDCDSDTLRAQDAGDGVGVGITNRELSPTCQLFLPTSSQVVLTAIILVSEVRKSGLEIISGFASGLRRKDLELGFEPKTVNHFPLHQEEERKERGSGPHRARPCLLGTQLKSFVRERPALTGVPEGWEPRQERPVSCGLSLGLWSSQARPRISGRAGPFVAATAPRAASHRAEPLTGAPAP